mgnify:CR=1 FL=1
MFFGLIVSLLLLSRVAARRVVAVGDLHGDLGASLLTLSNCGLISKEAPHRWTGGSTTLVQLGDLLDRGCEEPEVLELLKSLRTEARAAGGDVVTLLGNHEILNVCGQAANFVHPKAMDSFGPDRFAAFAPGSPLARDFFAECLVVAIIDDTAYVHAALPAGPSGWPSLPTRESIAELNAAASAWLRGESSSPPKALQPDHHSPVWNRAYSSPSGLEPAQHHCQDVKKALASIGVRRMVVGHTPQDQINCACDGTVWRCDTGMSAFVMSGACEALEVNDGVARVLGRAEGEPCTEEECAAENLSLDYDLFYN